MRWSPAEKLFFSKVSETFVKMKLESKEEKENCYHYLKRELELELCVSILIHVSILGCGGFSYVFSTR